MLELLFKVRRMSDAADKSGDHNLEGSLLSPTMVQAVFGRSARTLRRWTKRGLLTPIYMGGSVFFSREEIDGIISDQLRKRVSRR